MSNFTEELKEKYPLLFSNNEMEPITLFGVECDSGWHHIIKSMCHLMYQKYNTSKRNYEYWASKSDLAPDKIEILNKSKIDYQTAENDLPVISQIKEKFGTLRVYVNSLTNSNREYVYGLIDMAEAMSEVTCEKCGSLGKTYTTGWHRTLCTEHAKQIDKI